MPTVNTAENLMKSMISSSDYNMEVYLFSIQFAMSLRGSSFANKVSLFHTNLERLF